MKLIKVGISGCLGRMGQELVSQSKNDKRISFIGGFDLKDKKNFSNNVFKKAEVVIDFSSPDAVQNNLEMAINIDQSYKKEALTDLEFISLISISK